MTRLVVQLLAVVALTVAITTGLALHPQATPTGCSWSYWEGQGRDGTPCPESDRVP